jgi:hypothetical protein
VFGNAQLSCDAFDSRPTAFRHNDHTHSVSSVQQRETLCDSHPQDWSARQGINVCRLDLPGLLIVLSFWTGSRNRQANSPVQFLAGQDRC